LDEAGWPVSRPRPLFGHGAHVELPARPSDRVGSPLHLLGCYHVSQQNTFTGKLTPAMLEDVLIRAKEHAGIMG
jgi:uracil-DNA glycosylase